MQNPLKSITLTERLAQKASELRAVEADKTAASYAHLDAADRASAQADAAKTAAIAVENAQAILAEAGVSI